MYSFLAFLLWLLALPLLLLAPLKSKFRTSIPARFFLWKNKKQPQTKFAFHACSLGEVSAVLPFAKRLDARITTTTQTGFAKASQSGAVSAFLPFEWLLPFWWSPCETLVVFEAELWLNLFRVAKKGGAKCVLLNARVSEKSFPKYRRFAFYYRKIFACIDLVMAQSEEDAVRLKALGAKNVEVFGNVKSACLPCPTRKFERHFERVIVLASTHENEEARIFEVLQLLRGEQLLVVPRHPERFEAVAKLAQSYAQKANLSFARFSLSGEEALKARVVLVDKLGELVNFYQLADVAVLCGSFEDGIGGHNPLEAAQFGTSIVSGEFYFNQKPLYEAVKGIALCDYSNLDEKIHSELPKTQIRNRCEFEAVVRRLSEI